MSTILPHCQCMTDRADRRAASHGRAAPRAVFKHRIAAKFGKAAVAYESAAAAQMEILGLAAKMIREDICVGELWCDIGSGGGMLAKSLSPLPLDTKIVCFDIAEGGLKRAAAALQTNHAVCGDVDFPPFKRGVFSGAAALSMLQWSADPAGALENIAGMLKTKGRFYFSVFADGAFTEIVTLRKRAGLEAAVWLPAEDEFFSMLDEAGFDADLESVIRFDKTLLFPDAAAALRSLSGIGATAPGNRLLNRSELGTLRKDYAAMFSVGDKVTLTYHAVIGKAVKR